MTDATPTQPTGSGKWIWRKPLTRDVVEFGTLPDPRDARIAELEAQAAKARQLPQQIMDAIEQYDWDGERWFIDDIRALIEGKAGYPSRDDSLWFTGDEWQGLLDRAIGGECAQRDARIVRLENALVEVRNNLAGHSPLSFQDVLNMRLIDAALMYPEGDMSVTHEEWDA